MVHPSDSTSFFAAWMSSTPVWLPGVVAALPAAPAPGGAGLAAGGGGGAA